MKMMLRTLCAATIAALATLASAPTAKGESETIGNVKWSYELADGEATVTDMDGPSGRWDDPVSGDVVVPDTLGGCPVVAINNYVFYGNGEVTSLKFPDSLRKIGDSNFKQCPALDTVTFGTGLETLGAGVFAGSTRVNQFVVPGDNPHFSAEGGILYSKDRTVLVRFSESATEFEVPASVKVIGEQAFYQQALSRVTLPEGLEEIRDSAFAYNENLQTVVMPSGRIGENAFSSCTALKTLELGDGVTAIERLAFGNCTALETVLIPNSVTNVGGCAFLYCDKLADVTIGSGVARLGKTDCSIESNEWGYVGFDNAEAAFSGCDSLLDFKLAEGNATFEEIGGALYYRATPDTAKALAAYPSGRSELYFPSGITVAEIGPAACAQCNQFTEVAIPASVREIGVGSFNSCQILAKLTVPAGPTNISAGAFELDMMLQDVEIAGTVKSIGAYAFRHDFMGDEEKEGRLVLHEGIESIGMGAFEMNRDLREIVIPDSVTALGRAAFMNSQGVTRAVVGAGVTALPDELFYCCSLIGELTLRGAVAGVGTRALHLCESLPYIALPDVETIGEGAFYRCEKMTRIDLGDSLRTIGVEAFDYCIRLRDVIVPAGTVEIGDRAFRGCTELETAYLPVRFEGVLDIGSVFQGCSPEIVYYGDSGPATVTVTFVSAGEVVGRMDYLPGILDYLPEAVPSAPGLAFIGWFTEPEGGHLATGADLTGNTTLYAQFTESPFTDAGKWKPAEDPDASGTIVWRSAEISRGQSAEATLAVAGPGVLTFSWKFVGDRYDDALSVLVDSEEAARGTNTAWEVATVEIAGAGSHEVVWRFRRSSWSSRDDACGWLKDIAFAPAGGGGGDVEADIGGNPVHLERGEDGRTYRATVPAGTDPADVAIKVDGTDVTKGFRRSVEGTTFTAVLLDPYDVPKEDGAPGALWTDNGNGTVTLNVTVVPGLYYAATAAGSVSAYKRPAASAPSTGTPITLGKPEGPNGFFGVWVDTQAIPAAE